MPYLFLCECILICLFSNQDYAKDRYAILPMAQSQEKTCKTIFLSTLSNSPYAWWQANFTFLMQIETFLEKLPKYRRWKGYSHKNNMRKLPRVWESFTQVRLSDEFWACDVIIHTLMIWFSTRGTYLLLVPQGRAFIWDRMLISFFRKNWPFKTKLEKEIVHLKELCNHMDEDHCFCNAASCTYMRN